jgi:DNA-binding response OmpR family regulator
MNRFLVIDQDRAMTHDLGLACLERGVGVALAETVCEGVRVLLAESVSLVVVDAALLHLTAHETATLFARVAPDVPVVVVVRADTPLETRVSLELAGFTVLVRPVVADDLLKALAVA